MDRGRWDVDPDYSCPRRDARTVCDTNPNRQRERLFQSPSLALRVGMGRREIRVDRSDHPSYFDRRRVLRPVPPEGGTTNFGYELVGQQLLEFPILRRCSLHLWERVFGVMACCFPAADHLSTIRAYCSESRGPISRGKVANGRILPGGVPLAPKGRCSPRPGRRPGRSACAKRWSAQRAKSSVNGWPVGPKRCALDIASAGRCPGLGERLGLWPVVANAIVTSNSVVWQPNRCLRRGFRITFLRIGGL
jgi:hypothetical protein